MTSRPAEANHPHTRLLKCTLEIEDSRAYWQHVAPDGQPASAVEAFEQYWFGARSLSRIKDLMINFRDRFDAYPAALRVLIHWPEMAPDVRRLICHWHVQLSDPLYRAFAGHYLFQRRQALRPEITRDLVVAWVSQEGASRWSMATRIQFASKLLSAAFAAGLVGSIRDPRPLVLPRVSNDALTYLLYLLRDLEFSGTLLENPYLASVGLDGPLAEDRLRALPALGFRRQGDLIDFGWRYPDLEAWARAKILPAPRAAAGGLS